MSRATLPASPYGIGSHAFRVTITALAWLGSAAGFWLLSLVAGPSAGALMFLPVIVTGVTWGFWAGFWAGLSGLALTSYPLYLLAPEPDGFFRTILTDGGPPTVVAMIIGGTVGYLRDLRLRLHAQHQQLLHHASHDALTELPNRAAFETRLARCLGSHTSVAVLFVDLDGFKRVNDTLGHATGDALLRAVAGRLRGSVRHEDLVARLAGDEFVLAFPDMPAEQVERVARKLLGALAAPFSVGEHTAQVGASIGVSLYPDDGRDIDTLLKRADDAMYRVKRGGKNSYTFY